VRTFCGQGGFFRCGRPHFLRQNLRICRKLCVCARDRRALESREIKPVRTFCRQGGQVFAILCGRLLWTSLNLDVKLVENLLKRQQTEHDKTTAPLSGVQLRSWTSASEEPSLPLFRTMLVSDTHLPLTAVIFINGPLMVYNMVLRAHG